MKHMAGVVFVWVGTFGCIDAAVIETRILKPLRIIPIQKQRERASLSVKISQDGHYLWTKEDLYYPYTVPDWQHLGRIQQIELKNNDKTTDLERGTFGSADSIWLHRKNGGELRHYVGNKVASRKTPIPKALQDFSLQESIFVSPWTKFFTMASQQIFWIFSGNPKTAPLARPSESVPRSLFWRYLAPSGSAVTEGYSIAQTAFQTEIRDYFDPSQGYAFKDSKPKPRLILGKPDSGSVSPLELKVSLFHKHLAIYEAGSWQTVFDAKGLCKRNNFQTVRFFDESTALLVCFAGDGLKFYLVDLEGGGHPIRLKLPGGAKLRRNNVQIAVGKDLVAIAEEGDGVVELFSVNTKGLWPRPLLQCSKKSFARDWEILSREYTKRVGFAQILSRQCLKQYGKYFLKELIAIPYKAIDLPKFLKENLAHDKFEVREAATNFLRKQPHLRVQLAKAAIDVSYPLEVRMRALRIVSAMGANVPPNFLRAYRVIFEILLRSRTDQAKTLLSEIQQKTKHPAVRAYADRGLEMAKALYP